jgi:hypothetical protein
VTARSKYAPLVAELRGRGLHISVAEAGESNLVLVIHGDAAAAASRSVTCVGCGVEIPSRTGPGRPRQRCELCRHPLTQHEYRQQLAAAAWKAPPAGTPEWDAYMAVVYRRLGGRRHA